MSFTEWSNAKKKKEEEEEKSKSKSSSTSTKTSKTSSATTKTASAPSRSGSTGSSFTEWSNNKTASSSAGSWLEKSNDLLNEVQQYYSKWHNDDKQYSSFQNRASTLLSMADGWRKRYSDNEEAISKIDSVASSLGRVKEYAYNRQNYYSRWDSENSYKASIKQAEEDSKRWTELSGGYDRTKNQQEGQAGWQNYLKTQEQKVQDEEDKKWYEKLAEYLGNVGSDTTMAMPTQQITDAYRLQDDQMRKPDERWNEEQQETFGYLWNTDPEKAEEYAFAVNNKLNTQQEQKQLQKIQSSATDNGWSGAAHTAGAIATGSLGLADYLGDMISKSTIGYIPEADGIISPYEYSQMVTSSISQELNDKYGTLDDSIPVIGGKGLGEVYGLGTSAAQSMIGGKVLGQATTLISFFGSAAASGVDEAKKRGATDDQALAFGTIAGASEALTELVPLDNLMNMGKAANWKGLFSDIIKQGGEEFLGEGTNAIITSVADYLTFGDKSEYETLKRQYMESGLSEDDASKKAFTDIVEDVAFDALGGFATGTASATIMGSTGAAMNQYSQNKQAQQLYGESQQELVGEALEIDPENSYAQKMQNKLSKGKDLSGGQLNRLVQQNEAALTAQDMSTIQTATENRLANLGETGDVSAVAAALTKQAAGQKLTKSERQVIADSKYGQRISNELNPENIRSGEYSSAWAENLNTQRINAEEYNRIVHEAQLPQETEESPEDTIVDQTSQTLQNAEETSEGVIHADETENASEVASEDPFDVSEDGEGTILQSTGETVSIESVGYANNGRMTLRLADGRTVSSDSVSHESAATALVYDTVQEIANDAKSATVMVKGFKSGMNAETYAKGIRLAHMYGKNNLPISELSSGSVAKLPVGVKNMAYKAGQIEGGRQTARAQAAVNSAKKSGVRTSGNVLFYGSGGTESLRSYVKNSGITLNEQQEAGIKVMEKMAPALGVDFYVYESYLNKSGKRVYINEDGNEVSAPNGYYTNGKVYIDLNAGNTGKGTMLFTVAHELTHHIKKWSPAKFKTLSNFVIEQYSEQGHDVSELVARQIEKAKTSGRSLSFDDALEEVVADSMEGILTDGKVVQMMADIKQQDVSLWQKIKDWFKNLAEELKSIVKAYAGYTPDSIEGRMVSEMQDVIEQIEQLYAEALVDTSENIQSSLTPGQEGTMINEDGDYVAHSTDDGTIQLSLRTYEEDGRKALRDYLTKCVSSNKLTKAEMHEMLDDIEDIYEVCKEFKDKYAPFSTWSDAAVIRDTHGKPVFSVVTPNGDYKMNLDFSLVCKKRRTLDAVFNEMSKRGIIDDFELGQKSVVKINEIIRKHGLETACALCFVDAKRFRQASMADSFTNLYNDLVLSLVPEDQKGNIDHFNFSGYENIKKVENGIHTWNTSDLNFSHINDVMRNYGEGTVEYKAAKYIKSHAEGRKLLLRGDFMSSQGFDAVKTQNQDILKLYNSKKGTGGPKAAFGDVQYMNEIVKKARFWTPAKAYAVGGIRIQSFSDYVPRMVFDYVQMIYDLAATKLPAHAYTKEALFVKQFGLTGVKINMSLIPAIADGGIAPGLDANGDYVWAGESFDYDIATEIQNSEGYTENCGTICVGVSFEHIKKLLADPNIRMVIPYHKSGLNPIVAHMNKIAEFHDYTNDQRTKGKDGKALEKDFDFSKALHDMGANASPKAVADQYLKWCAANGYTARFSEFAEDDNYYKLLEDFTLYDKDGNYVPQREVMAVFPKEGSAFGSMKDLIQAGLEEDAIVEGKRDKSLSSIVDEIQKTLPRTEAEIAETQVAQADRDLEAVIEGIEMDVHTDDAMAIAEQVTDATNTTKFSFRESSHRNETYSMIGKELLTYEEGNAAPDLTLVETLNERTGKTETTIKHFGQKPRDYVPKKIAYCYKLFEQHPDGTLHALFAGAKGETPIGVWQYAQGFPYTDAGVKGMNLRERYGWHLSAGLPSAPHLMSTKDFSRGYPSKNAYGHPKGSKRVWVRMAYDASTDFNSIADSTKEGDIFGLIPFGGYYAFKENNQSEWVISSAVKIDKILSEDERQQILRDAGYDEYEAWRKKHRATDEEKAENKRKSAANKKAKDNAVKAGLNYLSESSKAMRESIKSRIIDNPEIKYSDRDNAPTFYSQMAKVVDGVKQEKLGAASVVNMLRGKGVKAEEIKWSGIAEWLAGKKSVTKAELQDFIAGSMLQIKEEQSGNATLVGEDGTNYESETAFKDAAYAIVDAEGIDRNRVKFVIDTEDTMEAYAYVGSPMNQILSADISEAEGSSPRWGQYKLDGGENYREIVFTMPNSSYSNQMMRLHWGYDAEGVLAHARLQDFVVNDKKMLFVEEIQSDWHNEGHKSGYESAEYKEAERLADEMFEQWRKIRNAMTKYARSSEFNTDPEDVRKKKWDWFRKKEEAAFKKRQEADALLESLLKEGKGTTPDAPFRENYHEYVLKRLIREAAEKGYDSIGWTTADIQSERWSDEYAEGYRIEYDQDIPKFLSKYGKKWGAKVGKTEIPTGRVSDFDREMAARGFIDIIPNQTEVWFMPITDSMKESVLTEGQPMYQDRDFESVSNRSLLANAFEGVAQNDIEKQKIQEYKDKISLIEAEERKLSDLNAKIKTLSFTKGPRDTQAIRDLQFEAKQTANRINTYDKQILRLEASKPLQDVLTREKKMAYKRAEKKGKDALEAYKEKVLKTQRELITKWQDSRKKGIESKHKTVMRHKIKDVVNDLNQYLLNGTKERHVPESLQKAVAETLNAVNMDTVGAEERIAKLQAELVKAKTPEKIQEISRKIDNIREMGDKINGKLEKLKNAYDELLKSPDENTRNSYDEVIHNKLDSVIDKVGSTPLRDMSLAQLEDVYDMYRMVLKVIRDANKSFKDAKKQSISTRANAVMAQVEGVGGKHKLSPKMLNGIKKFGWNNLKPVYAFEHIGSITLTEAFNNVRAGEDVWAVDVTEAREFYLDKAKKYKYDSWNLQKTYKFKSTSDMEFSLNLEQIMSLYAYSKREQARDHLKYGGIVYDESTKIIKKTKLGISLEFNPTDATAYNISEETLADIISKLDETAGAKEFVDEMQDYLSSTMGAKGNEVSMEMYDIKLFKEKNYFPLKSAQQFMEKVRDQQKGEVKIKNSGFSKATVPHAKNPIVLTPFMEVWSNHVNEMSMYHAFVLPLEDFYRIYNYKTPSNNETLATEGVNQYIQNAYGRAATAYIDQLLKDLNGGARTDSTTGIINKGMGLFKKGAVFASMSVVVQQPSAIARAAALVDSKYFIGPKVDHKRHKILWNEVKQYAPVAIIKEMGYFDTNMGKSTQDFITSKEYSGISQKMKALFTDSGFRDEALSKAPALADEIAWCGIWEAVKRETKAKNKDIDTNSEEFLNMVGKRFTEVIVKTQVYDSVLSRSGLMRSKDTGMKMATAFMAEPTTSINMISDALLKGKRGNRKYTRKAIGAVVASQILNSILVSFVYAGRDDDEDKTYAEKYVSTLSAEVLDSLNPAGYIPFIKDIMSIVQGYDVERSDMAVISDLWKAWENLSKDNVSVYRKVEGFAGSIAQMFGLPVKNIMRDARGIYQTVDSFTNGQHTTKAGIEYAVNEAITGDSVSDAQQLYEAILSGDQTQIERVKGRFEDESAITSAIRKTLRENDPRIHEAAVAWNSNDLTQYLRIAKDIINENNFSQDDVVSAIRSEANSLVPDEETSSTSKAKGLFITENYTEAIVQGDTALANTIKADLIATAQKNGKSKEDAEKNIVSSTKGDLKEMFFAGSISKKKAISSLVTYCDETNEDAEKRVGEWAFENEYGFNYSDRAVAYKNGSISADDLKDVLMSVGGKTADEADLQIQVYDWEKEVPGCDDITMSAIRDYNDNCAHMGISKSLYYEAWTTYKETDGDYYSNGDSVPYSKVLKMMPYINSLKLSANQKTALATCWWAEATVNKYKLW